MADDSMAVCVANVADAAWKAPCLVRAAGGGVGRPGRAVLNTIYLFNHCPLDLSEDEAHYWLWSEHLDYGYYSKPPGIAWVIWGTLRVGGRWV